MTHVDLVQANYFRFNCFAPIASLRACVSNVIEFLDLCDREQKKRKEKKKKTDKKATKKEKRTADVETRLEAITGVITTDSTRVTRELR